jgi:hypothetical protein
MKPSSMGLTTTGAAYSLPERRPLCRITQAYQWRRPASFIIAGLRTRLLKARTSSMIGLISSRDTAK